MSETEKRGHFLTTKLTLWASPLGWHFHDKVAAKLDVSLHFEKDILATKLTLWASPLGWHFHDKVAAKLGGGIQVFFKSTVFTFWKGHFKSIGFCILKRTFSWQSWHLEPILSDDIFMTKLQQNLMCLLPTFQVYCLYILKRTFSWKSWHSEPLLSDDIFMTKLQQNLMCLPSTF